MQLKDIAVLITGGGSGLGAATARAMAAKGAKIAVLDQSKENAEKVAAEVKGVGTIRWVRARSISIRRSKPASPRPRPRTASRVC
jgi:NAD(P)-dependent dehydrogenase (short-subunit alcohol dehydrogenase family)